MAIKITRVSEARYEAEVSPPEARESWRSPIPMSLRELIDELKRRGCHQTDITDVLYELDPDWVSKLK
jgi:hypothetical protein